MFRHFFRHWPVFVALAWTSAPAGAQTVSDRAGPASSAERLVIGDGYVVKVRRGDAQHRLVGDLVGVNDRWIVLHTRTLGNEMGLPAAPKNWLGQSKAFKNAGREVRDEFLWIPRDAALIERHNARGSKLPAIQIFDDSPPRQTACTVELAAGYQVDRQEGQYLGFNGSDLGLARESGQPAQRIAYAQILCLRFRQAQRANAPAGIAAK